MNSQHFQISAAADGFSGTCARGFVVNNHCDIRQIAGHFAGAGTKIAFGIIMCTPLLPSTSSVMLRSAATLDNI
jgi:hypothetical protein